jgi:hypothetical protein
MTAAQDRSILLLLLLYYYYFIIIITAIGLSSGDSSPTLVQTKIKIHKTTEQLQVAGDICLRRPRPT